MNEPSRIQESENSEPRALISAEGENVDPFTPGRIFAVAMAGTFTSLLLYYAYQQLEFDSKKKLKNNFLTVVKGQVRNFVGPNEE